MTVLKPHQLEELKAEIDTPGRRYGRARLPETEVQRRRNGRAKAQNLATKRLRWRHREEYKQLYEQACRDLGV